VIRGPRTQEALVRWLLSRKAELLAALDEEQFVCTALERHWGLPPGFLRLYTPREFQEMNCR
jgi:hypothetical protein